MDFRRHFEKLGNTPYFLRNFDCNLPSDLFIPASDLSECRRKLVETMNQANLSSFPVNRRRPEVKDFPYPEKKLDFKGNVCNIKAREFYKDHQVHEIEDGVELKKSVDTAGIQVMTTRHCILRELGLCKQTSGAMQEEPLFLSNGVVRFRLSFDCDRCEMKLFKA